MILQKIATFILCLSCVKEIRAVSYSKVYVQSGSDVGPFQFVNYGPPSGTYGSQLGKISAAPVGSVLPLTQVSNFATPCVSPCIPAQPIAPVASAPLVAYGAPSAQVVVAKDPSTAYEYSYMVYDDGTGDKKAQKETSDGVAVRGLYSFIQPDGYVREVKYNADDKTGFNAVINFLPAKSEVKEPCPEVKNEALREPMTSSKAPINVEDGHGGHGEFPASSEAPARSSEPSKTSTSGHKEKSSKASSKIPKETIESPAHGHEQPLSKAPPAIESHADKVQVNSKEPGGDVVTAEVKEEKKPDGHEHESNNKHAENAVVEQVPAPTLVPAYQVISADNLPIGYPSYNQLTKCIQAMKNAELRSNSPLTYFLLPSTPC